MRKIQQHMLACEVLDLANVAPEQEARSAECEGCRMRSILVIPREKAERKHMQACGLLDLANVAPEQEARSAECEGCRMRSILVIPREKV